MSDVVEASVVTVEEPFRLAFVGDDVDALTVGFDDVAWVFDEDSDWEESEAVDEVVEEYGESAELEAVLAAGFAPAALAACLDWWRFVVFAPPALSGTLPRMEEGMLCTTPPVDSIQRHLRRGDYSGQQLSPMHFCLTQLEIHLPS